MSFKRGGLFPLGSGVVPGRLPGWALPPDPPAVKSAYRHTTFINQLGKLNSPTKSSTQHSSEQLLDDLVGELTFEN
jgi:hypothetical protein